MACKKCGKKAVKCANGGMIGGLPLPDMPKMPDDSASVMPKSPLGVAVPKAKLPKRRSVGPNSRAVSPRKAGPRAPVNPKK